MIEFGSDFDQSAAPPFIQNLWESRAGVLHILVSLASVGGQTQKQNPQDAAVDELLGRCPSVTADINCTYEIIFEDYILCQTCRKNCARWKERKGRGKYFAMFSQSALLQELPQIAMCQDTWDRMQLPRQYIHYGILAQERVVDIISYQEPVIIKRNNVLKKDIDPKKRRFVISRPNKKSSFIKHELSESSS